MRINMAGWHWKHPADLSIVRPDGVHGMQVILVQSRGRIVMGGNEYTVGANTVFVVDTCVPHEIHADGEEYMDDWVRFELEDNDKQFIEELGIEFNAPIQLDSDIVSRLISVCADVVSADAPCREETERALMNAVIYQIKRCYVPNTKAVRTHYDIELDSIRRQIYSSPATDWTIPLIAEKLSLSVAHFQRLYKQRYGISCTKDILTSRMELAEQLLSSTDLSAAEVADKCGYSDYSHFSRVFQKYACVSPARFRKDKQ